MGEVLRQGSHRSRSQAYLIPNETHSFYLKKKTIYSTQKKIHKTIRLREKHEQIIKKNLLVVN
jgi:hypothetical protein